MKELAAQVGIQKSFPFPQLKEVVGKAIAQGRKVHFLPPYRFDNMMLLEDLTGIRAAIVKKYASVELIKAVVDLRSVKEACEIAEIDLACNIGYEMHTAAMRLCKPGIKGTIYRRSTGWHRRFLWKHDFICHYPDPTWGKHYIIMTIAIY